MSLTVAGVWEPGVWATTVWADGVWSEEPYAIPSPLDTILFSLYIDQSRSISAYIDQTHSIGVEG